MRNTPTTEVLTEAAERREAGESIKDILADTGISYPQFWNFWARFHLETVHPELIVDTTKLSETQLGQAIAKMRKEGGEYASWGWIMARTNSSEGKVRKLWEQVTDIRSDGLRIGKGGRFVQDESSYYVEDNRKTGVVTPKGEQHRPPESAELDLRAKLGQQNLKTLRGLAKQSEIKGYGSLPKADLVEAIVASGAKLSS